MYVPGNDERKISKIPHLGADCICLDCEDGVALTMKVKNRMQGVELVVNWLIANYQLQTLCGLKEQEHEIIMAWK